MKQTTCYHLWLSTSYLKFKVNVIHGCSNSTSITGEYLSQDNINRLSNRQKNITKLVPEHFIHTYAGIKTEIVWLVYLLSSIGSTPHISKPSSVKVPVWNINKPHSAIVPTVTDFKTCWTLICPVFANSNEANWFGSALFVITYVNLCQKMIGWKLNRGGILIYSAWQGWIFIFT